MESFLQAATTVVVLTGLGILLGPKLLRFVGITLIAAATLGLLVTAPADAALCALGTGIVLFAAGTWWRRRRHPEPRQVDSNASPSRAASRE